MKQIPGQLSFQDCFFAAEFSVVNDIGKSFKYHGKRLMFCDLEEYYNNNNPILINSCTESLENYTLVKIVNISIDRITFTTGTKHYGYLSRFFIDSKRSNVNYLCDSCNEQGWVYSLDGNPDVFKRGNCCLFNSNYLCSKYCDSIVRFDCLDWRCDEK